MVATALTYPAVRDEWATIRAVAGGYSIARFGDGELKMMHGCGYVREAGSPKLAAELRGVLQNPHTACIVGVPTMDGNGPKYRNWIRHERRYAHLLKSHIDYHSAFISRPDSAPWINCPQFLEIAERIWLCKRVAVLCEPDNSILRVVRRRAREVLHVECPSAGAYLRIDEFEEALMRSTAEVVVMSAGPTATCLANRLAGRGLQAVDIGSAGGFLWKLIQQIMKS